MLHRSKLALGLWMLAIALVAVRMSGVHLHLCADGQEAPIAVHVQDGSLHHPDTETDHQDRDLSIFDAALAKKNDAGTDFLPLLSALLPLLVLPRVRSFVPHTRIIPLPSGPRLHFTPPLRGPPL